MLMTIALASLAWLGLAGPIPPVRLPTSVGAHAQTSATAPDVVDVVVRFTATDGTALEAKLSVPAGAVGPVPVMFHLDGSGPRNYDQAIQYRDADGRLRVYRYYDFYAHELARRGLAFFRMSKRGCAVDATGRPVVDRSIFSKTTPSVLIDDYEQGLEVLRRRKEIDASRIVLSGASEGTRLAPQLAFRSRAGVIGLVLLGYEADNAHDTIVWQNTVGPWRTIVKLIPEAAGGSLTKADYDAAVKRNPSLASQLSFERADANGDSVITPDEVSRLTRPRLDAILKAVEEHNDDYLWQNLLKLSSAGLLEDWHGEPTTDRLVRLEIPVGIFHGELDGATRVEGAHEAEEAFRKAGKSNLVVHIYPAHDHDLNLTVQAAQNGGPVPFKDAFTFAAEITKPRRASFRHREQGDSPPVGALAVVSIAGERPRAAIDRFVTAHGQAEPLVVFALQQVRRAQPLQDPSLRQHRRRKDAFTPIQTTIRRSIRNLGSAACSTPTNGPALALMVPRLSMAESNTTSWGHRVD